MGLPRPPPPVPGGGGPGGRSTILLLDRQDCVTRAAVRPCWSSHRRSQQWAAPCPSPPVSGGGGPGGRSTMLHLDRPDGRGQAYLVSYNGEDEMDFIVHDVCFCG